MRHSHEVADRRRGTYVPVPFAHERSDAKPSHDWDAIASVPLSRCPKGYRFPKQRACPHVLATHRA